MVIHEPSFINEIRPKEGVALAEQSQVEHCPSQHREGQSIEAIIRGTNPPSELVSHIGMNSDFSQASRLRNSPLTFVQEHSISPAFSSTTCKKSKMDKGGNSFEKESIRVWWVFSLMRWESCKPNIVLSGGTQLCRYIIYLP